MPPPSGDFKRKHADKKMMENSLAVSHLARGVVPPYDFFDDKNLLGVDCTLIHNFFDCKAPQ